MAEYSANAIQTVAPGEAIIFTESPSPCERGFVKHRDGSGVFILSGWTPNKSCGCKRRSADYLIDFGANLSIPAGQTPGAISVALSLDGATIPTSTMTVTPTDTERQFNVSRAINVDVWNGCCETLTVRNMSAIPIQVANTNIIISRPDLAVTQ